MAYTSYKDSKYYKPDAGVQTLKSWMNREGLDLPAYETPITPKENFRRAIGRKDPIWLPIGMTDTQSIMVNDVALHEVRGMQIHANFGRVSEEEFQFRDWFNTDWTYVPAVGGSMLTPGTQLMDDITKWETIIEWPDLTEWGFEEKAAKYMREEHDPRKALKYNMGRGITERLVSVMGGYTDSMIALATEPEATKEFFEKCADFSIENFDAINALYPLDMVTLHDDWGTEKDTFFSEKMMEELVFEPTKRIIDHIKSKGVFFELHSCGNVTRFFQYMIDLGVDVLQLQRRAVDIPAMIAKYGNQIGYCAGVEGMEMGKQVSADELCDYIRKSVDIYAPGGGSYINLYASDPEMAKAGVWELYCYSRELYDQER